VLLTHVDWMFPWTQKSSFFILKVYIIPRTSARNGQCVLYVNCRYKLPRHCMVKKFDDQNPDWKMSLLVKWNFYKCIYRSWCENKLLLVVGSINHVNLRRGSATCRWTLTYMSIVVCSKQENCLSSRSIFATQLTCLRMEGGCQVERERESHLCWMRGASPWS